MKCPPGGFGIRIRSVTCCALLHIVWFMAQLGIYLESIEGIILGPKVGFIAALIGSSIARMIKPDDFWMLNVYQLH